MTDLLVDPFWTCCARFRRVAFAAPEDAPDLARVANDELQEFFARDSGWVASLPLNDVEASLEEMDGAMAARQPEKSALDTRAGGRLGGGIPSFAKTRPDNEVAPESRHPADRG